MVTKEQMAELEELSKPLLKWLNENGNPHSKLILECGSVELVSGVCMIPCTEFIKD